VQFSNARLAYPENNDDTGIWSDDTRNESSNKETTNSKESSRFYLENFSVSVPHWKEDTNKLYHRRGGIAIVGTNGSGKTLLGKAIIAEASRINNKIGSNNPYVASGTIEMPLLEEQQQQQQRSSMTPAKKNHRHLRANPSRSSNAAAAAAIVSFDSHRKLLQERDDKTGEVVTAFKAIATSGHAKLNPAARFLVIRFGLYPLLHRPVDTLSTGEIRKVLLAKALSTKPSLLILDHAFDGLDAPSRNILQELVSKTIRGFTNDLLVQGVNSKDTGGQTQVMLMAHRAEELENIREIDTVAWWGVDGGGSNSTNENSWHELRRKVDDGALTENDQNRTWSSGKEVLERAMGLKLTKESESAPDWEDPTLPSRESVRAWWHYGTESPTITDSKSGHEILVEARNLTIQKGDATLLQNLSWKVQKGERWIIGGGNGAGKSTLSRMLATSLNNSSNNDDDHLRVFPDQKDSRISWVSTESHMQTQQLCQSSKTVLTTREFLLNQSHTASWDHTVLPVLEWLGIATNESSSNGLLERPFVTLSQGEQKMVLLASALAERPPLLILDEPCQGLDLSNRKRLLQVVERICQSTEMALVYITHHLDEELLPGITHALHLKDRREVYSGPIQDYFPERFSNDE